MYELQMFQASFGFAQKNVVVGLHRMTLYVSRRRYCHHQPRQTLYVCEMMRQLKQQPHTKLPRYLQNLIPSHMDGYENPAMIQAFVFVFVPFFEQKQASMQEKLANNHFFTIILSHFITTARFMKSKKQAVSCYTMKTSHL